MKTFALITILLAAPVAAQSPDICKDRPHLCYRPTIVNTAGSAAAMAGVELPSVTKGETSWSVGVTFDGGIGLGIQHGLSDKASVYLKAGKGDGNDAIGMIGLAGKF